MNRIIDISTSGTRLSIFNGCLCIEPPKPMASANVPIEDILCVIVATHAATLTHAVLAQLGEAGVPYIACDKNYLPCGILLPYKANALQAERFAKQREFKFEDRLWQTLILGKLRNTAAVLGLWNKGPTYVNKLISEVELGADSSVAEAVAARYSFAQLFETGFERRNSGWPENARLNYGYTILRSMVARFVCAAGLHPTFGIHHHNRYNAFALADDLMEPFRPFVDHLVMEIIHDSELDSELQKEEKAHLSGGFFARWVCDGESRTLVNIIEKSVRSWAQFIVGNVTKLTAAPILERPENFEMGDQKDDFD
jgi:CRISP-associated protein Cas1